MFYKKYTPSKVLQPFIQCYYVWESDDYLNQPLIIESPPSGFASIVFNYGDSYTISNNKYTSINTPKCFFTGQSIKRYQLNLRGKIAMLGIVFKPAGLSALFKIQMYEFVEERIELELLFGKNTNFLLEQIAETKDYLSKFTIIEQLLLKKLQAKNISPSAMDYAANYIVNNNGNIKMDTILAKVFMSRRQFERRFLKRIGLSPKYYARIRRISTLCSVAVQAKEVNWQLLLGNSGFFDQAHFIKDFKEFMEVPPTEYYAGHTELVRFLKQS